METILWTAAAVVFLMISVISYFSLKRPHAKKMADEQEKLDKKTGDTDETIAAHKTENAKGAWGQKQNWDGIYFSPA